MGRASYIATQVQHGGKPLTCASDGVRTDTGWIDRLQTHKRRRIVIKLYRHLGKLTNRVPTLMCRDRRDQCGGFMTPAIPEGLGIFSNGKRLAPLPGVFELANITSDIAVQAPLLQFGARLTVVSWQHWIAVHVHPLQRATSD